MRRVINCLGIQENYRNPHRPLIRSLIRRGLASPTIWDAGSARTRLGALIDASGRVSTNFHLGPPRRGELLETTAVPRSGAGGGPRIPPGRDGRHVIELLRCST